VGIFFGEANKMRHCGERKGLLLAKFLISRPATAGRFSVRGGGCVRHPFGKGASK
jgi:hypothetical protein